LLTFLFSLATDALGKPEHERCWKRLFGVSQLCRLSFSADENCTFDMALFKHEFHGPGLCYEVAVVSWSSDICSINVPRVSCQCLCHPSSHDSLSALSPHAPGDHNDQMIFKGDLVHELNAGERVKADNVFEPSAPQFVKRPNGFTQGEEEKETRKWADGHHETTSERIQRFRCLVRLFKGKGPAAKNIQRHSNLFCSCCVTTQVAMELWIGETHELGDDCK
jgi:hypothetical protein